MVDPSNARHNFARRASDEDNRQASKLSDFHRYDRSLRESNAFSCSDCLQLKSDTFQPFIFPEAITAEEGSQAEEKKCCRGSGIIDMEHALQR